MPSAAPTQHSPDAGLSLGTVHPRVPTADRQWGRLLSPRRRGDPGQPRPSLRLVPAPHLSLDKAKTASRTSRALGTAEAQGSAVLEELESEASGPYSPPT